MTENPMHPASRPAFSAGLALLGLFALTVDSLAASEFEGPASISARQWWEGADWLENSLWNVRDEVTTGDNVNHYVVDSEYGVFKAHGDRALLERLREIRAIHLLRNRDVLKSGGEGALEVAGEKARLAEDIVEDPIKVAIDIPRGAGMIARRAGSKFHEERREGPYDTDGLLKSVIGADDKARELAARLEVDPYTENPAVQEDLARIAAVKALPEFGVGFVLPGKRWFKMAEAGAASRNIDAYASSPSDLFVHNRQALRDELGVDESLTAEFLSLDFTTPAQQTVLIQALLQLSEKGDRKALIEAAAKAGSREDFDSHCRSAELLAWYHQNRSPIRGLIVFGETVVGFDGEGDRILALPADLVQWTEENAKLVRAFAESSEDTALVLRRRASQRFHLEAEDLRVKLVFAE